MKKAKLEEISNHNSVPIMAWDFHYEYLNELKVTFTDLKKVKEISTHFAWDEENLNISERIKEEVVLVTDVDMKIVFASNGVKKMTGYAESEVLGKTPKMFQGLATSKTDLKEIRKAIELLIPFEKTITNYKKNGKMYTCRIYGSPVFNLKGKLTHFIAFEKEVLSA
ncbi:PAS domain-containing protein [Flavobacterium sp. CLA17]|uniref:PAS domain-containing protein n=1 Tax=Flavobacterium sp. CLA17 TaxID=2724135 RepID=UPI001490910D|nr:PAS domain-containing protein [Flavobacterium sp. CLA17]QSB27432.1 PAS domain-containing protein [Flavobacterium sp. CLA17]